jgi:hypothetical protein
MLREQAVTVEMKIPDKRHVNAFGRKPIAYMRNSSGRFDRVHRDANQFRSGTRECRDLHHGTFNVSGVGIRHGLHDDMRAAAHRNAAHENAA